MALTIQLLRASQVEAAKAVIMAGALEFFGQAPLKFEDMDEVASQNGARDGTFMVLLDGAKVVGTGAIRRLDDETCELKRMWFLPEYRGKGYGMKMSEQLLEFARSAGYQRVRLDSAGQLLVARKLYERLGFRPIERYNDGPGTIFMEKRL